jgi:hypothetical protein
VLLNCSLSRHIKLPKFSYNNKFHNSLILNRVAEYGDGERDGCIIMPEMYLSLKSVDRKKFEGEIKDAKCLEAISYASIQIFVDHTESSIQLQSDVNGRFSFIRQPNISKLKVSTVGYRTLVLDFAQSKIL